MTRITPIQFRDAFLTAVSSVDSQIVALWDERKDYTALMLKIVFPKIAAVLGIPVCNEEYYHLDSIFYAALDSDHFGPTQTYAKCINIAIEHEHMIAGTAIEMNKLQIFNTPLKVLITYAQTEVQRVKYLNRYTKILRDADIFGDFAKLRRQLVIFGSISGKVVTWHSYVYEQTGFQIIS